MLSVIKIWFNFFYKRIITNPHTFYLFIASIGGVLFIFASPPLTVPDEPAHFFRAYSVSEGGFVTQTNGADWGWNMPESIVDFAVHEDHYSLKKIQDEFSRDFDGNNRVFLGFINSAVYSPIPYLPQATGIFIAKLFHAPPIALLYIGRLTNLLCAIFLTYLAIKNTPILKWSFVIVALFPMVLHQYASLSADAMTISSSLLLFALVFQYAFQETFRPSRWWYVGILLSSFAIGLCKQAYVFLPLVVLLIQKKKFGSWKKYFLFCLSVFFMAVLPSVIWTWFTKDIFQLSNSERVDFVVSHPIYMIKLLLDDYLFTSSYYYESMIGYLGWLTVRLPFPLIFAYSLLFAFSIIVEKVRFEFTRYQRAYLFGLILSTMLLISVTLFITFSNTYDSIVGVQGRYFIPLLPLAALACKSTKITFSLTAIRFRKVYLFLFLLFGTLVSVGYTFIGHFSISDTKVNVLRLCVLIFFSIPIMFLFFEDSSKSLKNTSVIES